MLQCGVPNGTHMFGEKEITNTIEIPIKVFQQAPGSCKTFRDTSGIPLSRGETGNSKKLKKVAEENAFI